MPTARMRARRMRSPRCSRRSKRRSRLSRSRCSTSARTCASPSPKPRRGCTTRSGRWAASAAFSSGAKPPGRCCRAGAARFFSPARRPACAAARGSPRLPAPSTGCARWRRAWRANWAPKASTSRRSSSTAPSTPSSSGRISAALRPQGAGRDRRPRSHRRELLAVAPAAAQRLDARNGPAPLDRTLVTNPP